MTLPRRSPHQPEPKFLVQAGDQYLDTYDGGTAYSWTTNRRTAWAMTHDQALVHLRALKPLHRNIITIRQ